MLSFEVPLVGEPPAQGATVDGDPLAGVAPPLRPLGGRLHHLDDGESPASRGIHLS